MRLHLDREHFPRSINRGTYPISTEKSLDAFWTGIDRIPLKFSERAVVGLAHKSEVCRRIHRLYTRITTTLGLYQTTIEDLLVKHVVEDRIEQTMKTKKKRTDSY